MFSALFSLLPSRFSRLNSSLFVLAVSVLLLPLAERSSAQTFGGSNPITVSGTVRDFRKVLRPPSAVSRARLRPFP